MIKEKIIQIINGQQGKWRAQLALNKRMFGETSEASIDARARIDECIDLVNRINSNISDATSDPAANKEKIIAELDRESLRHSELANIAYVNDQPLIMVSHQGKFEFIKGLRAWIKDNIK